MAAFITLTPLPIKQVIPTFNATRHFLTYIMIHPRAISLTPITSLSPITSVTSVISLTSVISFISVISAEAEIYPSRAQKLNRDPSPRKLAR
ncbi:hypothetical protein [Vibrio hippocampi]|uniref:hypothetical protein n=1 Tax=Vibrio hippocampi TaxID=654686 RepID=UPI001F48FBED|nr:hypothetical protein [Vibrio hippocampi]